MNKIRLKVANNPPQRRDHRPHVPSIPPQVAKEMPPAGPLRLFAHLITHPASAQPIYHRPLARFPLGSANTQDGNVDAVEAIKSVQRAQNDQRLNPCPIQMAKQLKQAHGGAARAGAEVDV